jgi:3-oxoacyl-[acyl-carrier protein] reductase
MDFKDKVVVITGASSGIGSAMAQEFAKHNANIVINYKNSSNKALELQREIEDKYKVKTLVIKADVSNEQEVKEMVNKVIEKFSRIDILINNAGIAIDTIFEDKTKENFQKIINTNLIGTFLMCKYASKYMLEAKQGTIINISSTNGIDTYYPFSLDYDASKAGVNSLTKNLAIEFAPYVRVNAIAPGWVDTEMNKLLSAEFKDKELAKILLNRFADPTEIARVALFLASDYASYINGEIIRVDGGSNN